MSLKFGKTIRTLSLSQNYLVLIKKKKCILLIMCMRRMRLSSFIRKVGLFSRFWKGISSFKNSFIPHCINEWNNLSLEFREVRSLSLFKTKLIRLVRPEKGQLYGIHDHLGVCRLTQLRLGLSPLREHRFRHNFLDTTDPMCLSNNGIETTIHFMLLYQEYTIHRTVLLGKNYSHLCILWS